MNEENIKALENLSLYCHLCGLMTIFIGIVIVFIDVINFDMRHVQVGFFIFITGYAFVKISQKISNIIIMEKNK